jgi:AcrR family transcriptional regulator
MPPADPGIKKGRKFDQVLQGARTVFMQDGFEGANVDDIAKTAGVSKATLYSYFPDKRMLFAEVARMESTRQADAAFEVTSGLDCTPETVLHEAGSRLIDFFTSDFGLSMYRMCVSESSRFPELGKHFYASGPLLVRDRLAEFLTEAIDKGDLDIPDVDLAADQFAELCKASFFPRVICGVQSDFTAEETARILDSAIEMFMARYGTKT